MSLMYGSPCKPENRQLSFSYLNDSTWSHFTSSGPEVEPYTQLPNTTTNSLLSSSASFSQSCNATPLFELTDQVTNGQPFQPRTRLSMPLLPPISSLMATEHPVGPHRLPPINHIHNDQHRLSARTVPQNTNNTGLDQSRKRRRKRKRGQSWPGGRVVPAVIDIDAINHQ